MAAPGSRHAPWTAEEVENLNRYQRAGFMHPFTCGNDHTGDRDLVAYPDGWRCPSCGYRQDWAHEFMTGFTAEREQEMRELYPVTTNQQPPRE